MVYISVACLLVKWRACLKGSLRNIVDSLTAKFFEDFFPVSAESS